MATSFSGVEKHEFCNGYVSLVVEWSVEQDILNSTNTYTANLYLDTTKCFMVRHAGSGHNYISSFEFGGAGEVTFKFPQDLKVEKRLIASVSGTKVVDEADIDAKINVTCRFNGTIKAYKDLMTHIDSDSIEKFNTGALVSGINRTTIAEVHGTLILGQTQAVQVTRVREEFTHKVEYSCGEFTEEICDENSTQPAFSFVPSLDLAYYAPTSLHVPVTFTVTTYYQGHPIGSKTKAVNLIVPAEIKPSCSVEVTDGTLKGGQPLTDIYGGYVQKQSRFHIVANPVPAYGSPVVSYTIQANGSVYSGEYEFNSVGEAVTGLIKTSGTNEIIVTVTDQRGRTSEAVIQTFDVIPYSAPVVHPVKIKRCDADGVEQSNTSLNTHYKVTFNAEISPINNINSASYSISYQKVSGLTPNDVTLDEYAGQYSVVGGTYIFEADPFSAYSVIVYATDDFATGEKPAGGSTSTPVFNILTSGLGMCFGGVATQEKAIENRFLTYPSGGFMFPALEAGDSLYTVKTPNVYRCESGQDIDGSPTENPYILVVLPFNDDEITYIVIDSQCDVYVRVLVDSSWGVWKKITLTTA